MWVFPLGSIVARVGFEDMSTSPPKGFALGPFRSAQTNWAMLPCLLRGMRARPLGEAPGHHGAE